MYSGEENSAGQASSLNAIGWFHVLLGKPEEALDFCEHSLLLHRKLGDQHGEASLFAPAPRGERSRHAWR